MHHVFSRTLALSSVAVKISVLLCFAVSTKNVFAVSDTTNSIEQQLAGVSNKEAWLSEKLARTEKSIGEISAKYDAHQQQIAALQEQRKTYESTQQKLRASLHQAQDALERSLKNCYRLDIKTGLMSKTRRSANQEDSSEIDRITMYYHYLLSEKQKRITAVRDLHRTVQEKSQAITAMLQQEQALSRTLQQEKNSLQDQKQAQLTLLQSIRHHIPRTTDGLNNLAKDSRSLRKIVRENTSAPANRQDTAATARVQLLPFARLRHRLPNPLANFSGKPRVLHHGVTFFAGEGSNVQAVYPGKVVFSDWLKGYGLLIIVDHGQGYMTLYAHNRSLLKRKNDTVSQGEIIAKVGHTGGIAQNALYFEVRQRGQALSPLQWLA